MYIHYPGNSLGLRWTIYRGLSRITEDFESATLTCFLYSKDNKFPVEATVMSAADGGSYLYIELSPELQLPDGIYGVSAIWKKNEDRSIARSMREGLFSVVNNQAEATDQGGTANIPVLKFHSSAGTFGYDGLSAYELALLKGLTTKSETEWVQGQLDVATDQIFDAKDEAVGQAETAITAAKDVAVGQAEDAVVAAKDAAVSDANTAIGESKENALDAIAEAIEGLEVHYDIETDKGTVKDVQLKDGQGNKLMPRTYYDYDVSANNPTAGPNNDGKFESLSALLSDRNLDTLIPNLFRKGGMSIKYVQSSDNKYVQYRLMANGWSTNTENWTIAEEGTYVENPEYIYVKTDAEGKILWAIKADGGIYYGAGVPQQIIDCIKEKIAELNLVDLLNEKEDKVEGKSLIDAKYADSVRYIENPEFTEVKTDLNNKILSGIYKNGSHYIYNLHSESIDKLETEIANIAADITENVTKDVIDSVLSIISENYEEKLNIRQQAKTLISNAVSKFPFIKPKQEDIYVNLCGDSLFAYQNVFEKDELGVAAVPPTCDKKANANQLWNALKWGNAIYRRFDWGKASLVRDWDDTWSDDSEKFFTETGNFKTEYIGKTMRENPNFINKTGTDIPQISTKVDPASFPYQFDESENSWWQRNIPKRFSNEENASVQFVIPAGYKKFDLIYHAHIHGDIVTITTNRTDGVVKVNSVANDWENSSEANNYQHDTNLSNFIEQGGGNDLYGIPNMRLHFQISNTTQDTIVTITKTSDTTKYIIYWGVTYWGTSALPYAMHIDNMAIGGIGQSAMWKWRSSMFRYVGHDAIILESCYNSLAGNSIERYLEVLSKMQDLKTYFEQNLNLDISKQVGMWIPHAGVPVLANHPEIAKINYQGAERGLIDLGFSVLLNLKKIIQDINDVYYPEKSPIQMMQYLGGDGVHLGINGHNIYGAGWESLR